MNIPWFICYGEQSNNEIYNKAKNNIFPFDYYKRAKLLKTKELKTI